MNAKRVLYWAALFTAGAASLGLHFWALWLGAGRHGFSQGFGASGRILAGLFLVSLVGAGLFLWYRRRGEARIDPLGDLAAEYVEGRLTRDEFWARKAVLEEER